MLTSNVGEGGTFFRSRPDLPEVDLQFHFAPVKFYGQGLYDPDEQALTIGVTLVRVASRGAITLRSADPTWAPAIDGGYLEQDEDLEALVAGTRAAQEVLAGPAAAPGRHRLVAAARGRARRRRARATRSAAASSRSTTRSQLPDGHRRPVVVDTELRVHGVERAAGRRRLRHADAGPGQHQRAHDHDRRAGRRPGAGPRRPGPRRRRGARAGDRHDGGVTPTRSLPVPEGLDGLRLDAALSRLFGLSRSAAAAIIDGGRRLGRRAGARQGRPRAGGRDARGRPARARHQRRCRRRRSCPGCAVVHEDDDIVVVDKPVGVAAHPSPGWEGPTVIGGLAAAGSPRVAPRARRSARASCTASTSAPPA